MARKTTTASAESSDAEVGDVQVVPESPTAPAEPAPDSGAISATQPKQTARRGWAGPVIGGLLAAGMGFGTATYVLPTLTPASVSAVDLKALQSTLQAQDAQIGAFETRLASIPPAATPQDIDALAGRISVLESQPAAPAASTEALQVLADRIAEFEERLQTLERQPAAQGGVSSTAIGSFEREMQALRADLEAQKAENARMENRVASVADAAEGRLKAAEAEAERIRAEAEGEARRALARAGISHLRAAMESGAPIDGPLADIEGAGIAIPSDLADLALGVPTLHLLQARFDSAAREALTVSLRESAGDDWWSKVKAFLRSQSGARSLTPRSGDDPDAVLSRAAAALNLGDIAGAVNEVQDLPEAGRGVMAEWIGLAERRIRAETAVETLAQAVQ